MATQRNENIKQLAASGRDDHGQGATRVMHFDMEQSSQAELYGFIQEQVYSGEVSQNVVRAFEQTLVTEIDHRTADLALYYQNKEDREQRAHDETEFSRTTVENTIGEEIEVNAHNFHKAANELTDLSHGSEDLSRAVITEAYEAAVRTYDLEQNKNQPVQEQQQEFALER